MKSIATEGDVFETGLDDEDQGEDVVAPLQKLNNQSRVK